MKDHIKIVTTDSGLGGLSVTAELASRLKKEKGIKEAEITFCNCRPSAEKGYNDMENDGQRCQIFSRALYDMYREFEPDIILIACNTLSALYNYTDFARESPVPVMGIIESGVKKIYAVMQAHPKLHMALLGTQITVNSGIHKKHLLSMGIAEERLHYINSQGLQNDIEKGPESEVAVNTIREVVRKVANSIENNIFGLSLLCTHFGYSHRIFEESAKEFSNFSNIIINPNSNMVDDFLSELPKNKFSATEIKVKVRSQVPQMPGMVKTFSDLIKNVSLETAEALLCWNVE